MILLLNRPGFTFTSVLAVRRTGNIQQHLAFDWHDNWQAILGITNRFFSSQFLQLNVFFVRLSLKLSSLKTSNMYIDLLHLVKSSQDALGLNLTVAMETKLDALINPIHYRLASAIFSDWLKIDQYNLGCTILYWKTGWLPLIARLRFHHFHRSIADPNNVYGVLGNYV